MMKLENYLLSLSFPMGAVALRIRISFIFIFIIIMFLTMGSSCVRISSHHHLSLHENVSAAGAEGGKLGMDVVNPTGSSIPDCTHACGACYPCKRVMVSFKCSVAESCPVVYRCMCKGKYYHVPSN